MGWRPFRDAKTRGNWRDELMHRQAGRCAICGHRFPEAGELSESTAARYLPTFDHVIPRSKGGADDIGNLQLVHWACNVARGDGNGSKPLPSIPRRLRL